MAHDIALRVHHDRDRPDLSVPWSHLLLASTGRGSRRRVWWSRGIEWWPRSFSVEGDVRQKRRESGEEGKHVDRPSLSSPAVRSHARLLMVSHFCCCPGDPIFHRYRNTVLFFSLISRILLSRVFDRLSSLRSACLFRVSRVRDRVVYPGIQRFAIPIESNITA